MVKHYTLTKKQLIERIDKNSDDSHFCIYCHNRLRHSKRRGGMYCNNGMCGMDCVYDKTGTKIIAFYDKKTGREY